MCLSTQNQGEPQQRLSVPSSLFKSNQNQLIFNSSVKQVLVIAQLKFCLTNKDFPPLKLEKKKYK